MALGVGRGLSVNLELEPGCLHVYAEPEALHAITFREQHAERTASLAARMINTGPFERSFEESLRIEKPYRRDQIDDSTSSALLAAELVAGVLSTMAGLDSDFRRLGTEATHAPRW